MQQYEAEEKIKARERLAVRSVLPTAHVQEVKGESGLHNSPSLQEHGLKEKLCWIRLFHLKLR